MAEEPLRIQPVLTGLDARPDPVIRIAPRDVSLDVTTVFSLAASFALIAGAIIVTSLSAGQSPDFFDLASVLLVIAGTLTVTATSYTTRDLRIVTPMILGGFQRGVYHPDTVARELLDLSILARKRGILALSNLGRVLDPNPFMKYVVQMLADGLTAHDVDRLVQNDIDVMMETYKKAAGLLRRASEIAPAMGLIGTLIGLVQMLVSLDDPSSIGPAMAVALLTTFYGAIMGSVVLAPLAAKIERNANDEMTIKVLIHTAALSILAQGNPRKLEMDLNAHLAPDQRVRYFDY